MSGVYIPNWETPKSCGECKFFAWKRRVGNHCAIDESITFHPTLDGLDVRYEKNGNCPFIAVPDHGRLIDADALEELFREVIGNISKRDEIKPVLEHMVRASAMAVEMIKDAPTIIESEGE